MKLKKVIRFVLRVSVAVSVLVFAAWIYIAQPSCSQSAQLDLEPNLARLEEIVRYLSVDCHPRTFGDAENLEKASEYIYNHFTQAGGEVQYQEFEVYKRMYSNVRCVFGKGQGPRLIIGAHYDAHYNTPGADDNASGVAGLIELAYLLSSSDLVGEVELVAYSLEEPPFFATEKMGSHLHAQSIANNEIDIAGVIVLEMIGYFDDQWGSQGAPMLLLRLMYPNRGNFISVVGNISQRPFTKQVKVGMKGAADLDVYSVNAPRELPGIDFSDHRNYWPHEYNAVMITDTAFYRNKAYHTPDDTYDRLDYEKMGNVVLGVYSAILNIRKEHATE